ncbi:hypothetical protein ACFXTI_019244 [Malus domestica]
MSNHIISRRLSCGNGDAAIEGLEEGGRRRIERDEAAFNGSFEGVAVAVGVIAEGRYTLAQAPNRFLHFSLSRVLNFSIWLLSFIWN